MTIISDEKLKQVIDRITKLRALGTSANAHEAEAAKEALMLYEPGIKPREHGFNWGSDPDAYNSGKRDGEKINLGKHLGSGDGSAVTDGKQLKRG